MFRRRKQCYFVVGWIYFGICAKWLLLEFWHALIAAHLFPLSRMKIIIFLFSDGSIENTTSNMYRHSCKSLISHSHKTEKLSLLPKCPVYASSRNFTFWLLIQASWKCFFSLLNALLIFAVFCFIRFLASYFFK